MVVCIALIGTGLNGYGRYSFKNENYYYRSAANENDCLNCIMGVC